MIPVEEVGKAPDTVSLFRGHEGPVLDTAFDPFDLKIVASCSEDGEIYVWRIPDDYSFHNYRTEDDGAKDIIKPQKVLRAHTRKVGNIQFHPCAKDVLVSSSLDYSVKFWNVETATVEFTLQHPDMVTSFAFNYNGLLLATTSRDKKLRIWDLSTKNIISEAPGHTGAKPSRVTWLGNSNRICTTGFSRLSDRQVGIWDVNDLGKGSIDGFLMVDSSSGVLVPVFDESTSILYLVGKSDGNIRYFEFKDDVLFNLSQYASTDAQRGFAVAPKMYVKMKENEILKAFKTVNYNSIKPISFIVPRKSELFQEDIYPDARSDQPALSASEWFSGKVVSGPTLISMRKLFDCEPNQYVKEPEKMLQSKAEIKPNPQTKEAEKPSSKPTTEPNRQTTQVLDPPKTIDAFKSSSRVDDLLKRVELDTAQSEETEGTDDDSEWTEVRKPASVATKSSLPTVERDSKKEKSVETDTILSQSIKKTKDASQEKPKEQESEHVIQKESKDVMQKESKQENHAEESKDKPRKAESVQEDTNGQTQS